MSSAATDATPRPPITVCLVEDHDDVRDALRTIMTDAGMKVVAAVGTVVQGRQAVTEFLPDVAVIDNRLPDGTWIDLCRELSDDVPEVTLILHTGTVDGRVVVEAGRAGAVAVVLKEIRTDNLLDAIRRNRPPVAG
jgi:DNA-binding NarL/FixJ family response regulator